MPHSTDVRPLDLGVNFPLLGRGRSSTATGRRVLTEALGTAAPDVARSIAGTERWRTRYTEAFLALTRAEGASASAALDIARAGLRSADEHFVHVTPEGDQPLARALEGGPELGTAKVTGTGEPETRLAVPYRGELLHGTALLRQLDTWVAAGITEPSFADAVGAVVRHPEWLDLRDRTFALVGAGAAMGPYAQLLRWGATVAAVDLPRPEVWKRIIRTAEESAGTVLVPVRGEHPELAEAAGVNLLTEVGAVARWLREAPGPLTLGNYGYADGALFVRLSMAFELLTRELARHRDDLSLSYLATPSDAFLVPEDAVSAARRRYREVSPKVLAARAVGLATAGRFFGPSYEEVLEGPHGRFGLVNAFIVEQGQNYALAKRLQRWRMVVSRAEGTLTSVHVAPPTRTQSVHKNPVMAQRQRLTALLGIETFDADTSRALGAAMLVHDLRNPDSPANPEVPLAHPHEAFMFAANPGGRWRAPFDPGSSLPVLRMVERMLSRAGGSARGADRSR
jgi:hypothetical protein